MDKNMWENYFRFMKPEAATSNEINSWLQTTMDYMDDFMTFSKKICEMKATPEDVMLLWENSSKKMQGSMSDCMKMFGMADSSEAEESQKKLVTANNIIEDQKKKIKDQDKEMSTQKKEADKLNQLLLDKNKEMSAQKKDVDKLNQLLAEKDKEISAQKKEIDKLNQLLSDQKKEMSRLQQIIASLEAAAVKSATSKTSQ